MKRYVLIISGGSLFAWGVAGAMTGCGGEEETPIAADGDGGGASSSGGGSSGAASSSGGSSTSSGGGSSTSSSGGATDGGTDGSSTSSGGPVASNPGKITCGTKECTATTDVCCSQGGDAGCSPIKTGCGKFAQTLECDEKADCPATDRCCGSLQGNECKADCGFGEYVACKTNTECAGLDGGACKEWTCTFFKNEVKIRACENPSTQNCK